MNISNELKNKVIKHDELSSEEVNLFLKYIINKTQIITKKRYNIKDNNPMYLFYEICYSYNLTSEPFNDSIYHHAIIILNNKKYLVDINFNNNKIKDLKENKYIEYTDNIYKEYLDLIERER